MACDVRNDRGLSSKFLILGSGYALLMPLKVLHLSTYDVNGGAARAAHSLHQAMIEQGIDSTMIVGCKGSTDPRVHEVGSSQFRTAQWADRQLWRLQQSPLKTWRSPARFSSISAQDINQSDADIVHLHWVTDGFLSVEEIGRITKPIVWSMYDMWTFTGTEHYGVDTPNARWRSGYTAANRPPEESGLDIDRWTFQRKSTHWERISRTTTLVPASRWMKSAVEASELLSAWSIFKIPHVVDTDFFAPIPAHEARQELGLPLRSPLALFLSSAGIDDPRKGWDLLEEALPAVVASYPDLQVVIVGPIPSPDRRVQVERTVGAKVHWIGIVKSSTGLRDLYNSASVVVVPSRDDNMPLTAMEAQSCGRPVAGFAVGGLPDAILDPGSGALAPPGDATALSQSIKFCLDHSTGHTIRDYAVRTWSKPVVVQAFIDLYQQT